MLTSLTAADILLYFRLSLRNASTKLDWQLQAGFFFLASDEVMRHDTNNNDGRIMYSKS